MDDDDGDEVDGSHEVLLGLSARMMIRLNSLGRLATTIANELGIAVAAFIVSWARRWLACHSARWWCGIVPNVTVAVLVFPACLAISGAAAQTQTNPPYGSPSQTPKSPSTTDLAKAIQNPIGDLYYVPFQVDTNFGYGPNKHTQNILNVQPVIPIHINADWNIITRTIVPLVWNPSLQPASTVPFGSAPVTFSAFLSPSTPVNGWLWGAGPVAQVPLASSSTLGSNVWGGGPTAVIVKLAGPWVAGALINNVWSFGGHNGPAGTAAGGTRYNVMTIQAGASYNFDDGWYLTSAPVITANWLERGDNAWTVPLGGGIGRVVMLGGVLPVSFSVEMYRNVMRPQFGSRWQLLSQVTIIF